MQRALCCRPNSARPLRRPSKDLAEQTPLGRLGKPEDIAAAVAYLASDKASFVTGQVLAVDGAFVL